MVNDCALFEIHEDLKNFSAGEEVLIHLSVSSRPGTPLQFVLGQKFQKELEWLVAPLHDHEHFFSVSFQAVLDRIKRNPKVLVVHAPLKISEATRFTQKLESFYQTRSISIAFS